jgi:hypothetical protein
MIDKDDDVKAPAAPVSGPHPDLGPAADGAKASVAASIPKLRSMQPNQTFSHVGPVGNSYTSDANGLINPLTAEDAAALRLQGCVDV